MSFARLRELRKDQRVRDAVAETQLRSQDIIVPYFVVEGKDVSRPIASMPGVSHLSVDNVVRDVALTHAIHSVLLFGLPKTKDAIATAASADDGIVQRAVAAIKKERPDINVITDVCLCSYISHGHCGIVKNNKIDNDASIDVLAAIAQSHAAAGADCVAPSAMMDGQVYAIRKRLDSQGVGDTKIMAYSAKYASSFYGPFRDALDSTPQFGDRKTYQMDYRNSDEALREIQADIDEGADSVMVKPALAYLDIVYRAKQAFDVPIAAYNVSGEYAMIHYLSGGDPEKEKKIALELLTSIKRAGADYIISYFGRKIQEWLT